MSKPDATTAVSDRWLHWPDAFEGDVSPQLNGQKDILDGLSVIFQLPEITDLRNALLRYPDARLDVALNKKQTACKLWLADELAQAFPGQIGHVHILAGWYGVLAFILALRLSERIDHMTVVDRDPHCADVAYTLNATAHDAGSFTYHTADIMSDDLAGEPPADLIINTSCEHLPDFDSWYARLQPGQRVALQSNDYAVIPEHVNCVPDLDTFKRHAPLSKVAFAGALTLPKYTRFMLIGEV